MKRRSSFHAVLLALAGLFAQAAVAGEAKIATHGYFNLALDIAGNVWGWGDNTYGQLGRPVQLPQPTKVTLAVAGGNAVAAVAAVAAEAYGQNSLVLDREGGLWSFGENSFGQAGAGGAGVSAMPRRILRNVSKFSLGEHGLAVLTDGSLYAWGRNVDGELALPEEQVLSPHLVGSGYRDVAAGWGYSLALKSDGRLYAWGLNDCGQLGVDALIGSDVHVTTPTQVTGHYRAVSAGADHVVALATDGTVLTFGCNGSGQLGHAGDLPQATPQRVAGLDRIVGVVAGRGHSLALRDDGTLFAWGDNNWGQQARSDTAVSTTPVSIGTGFSAIGGKGDHVLGVKNGAPWAWGHNHMTQCAVDSDAAVAAPHEVKLAGVAQVAAGDAHSLAIDSDGSLWSWGDNRRGQLGVGLVSSATVPLLIGAGFKEIAAGYNHALGIRSDGSLWTWGSNLYGAMADGTRIDRHAPVRIADGVMATAAGKTDSVMLKNDGSVWQWGDSIGHRNDPEAPPITPQLKGAGYVSLTAGYTHFVGIKSDKSVWAWGSNDTCQLGNGGACQTTETPVKAGEGFVKVAAGQFHSVGLKENGELWGWGDNESGQLGVGPAIIRTPVKIGSGYTDVAAGSIFTLARKANGDVVGFGRWFSGDCQPLVRCDPLLLGSDFRSMAAGQSHFSLLKNDGMVYSRGQNYNGQLGDGTEVQRRSLVLAVNPTLDGFLNLNQQPAGDIPAEYRVPFFVATSGEMTGTRASLNVRTQFNPPDIGKQGAVFVTARVPKGTLPLHSEQNPGKLPATRSDDQAVGKSIESDIFELLQLTAKGWLIVSDGELFPYVTGVFGEMLDALTILDGYDPGYLPNLTRRTTERSTPSGAQFCVGYGSSASAMASAGRIRVVANVDDLSAGSAPTGSCVVTSATNGVMVPASPREVEARAGSGSAILTFTEPASNGGAPITGYSAVCSGNSAQPVTATGNGTPLTVTGLAAGISYSCTVTASNSAGSGSASNPVNAIPGAILVVLPGAPSNVVASVGDASLSVSFTPGEPGSGALLRYTATCTADDLSAASGTGSASPISVPHLSNGSAYVCRVKTTSSVGSSAWSLAANAVTPRALPDLVVSKALAAADSVKAAEGLSVTVNVTNQGTAVAAASRVEFRLLTTVASGSAALAGISGNYCDIPALSPGLTKSCTTVLRLPASAPASTRYLLAIADSNGQVLESNENNNTLVASSAIEVVQIKKRSIIPSIFLLLAE